jgi:hypothetical protein
MISLYVVWAMLGLAMGSLFYEPALGLVIRTVPLDGDRLRALASVTVIAGVASTIFLPLIAWGELVDGRVEASTGNKPRHPEWRGRRAPGPGRCIDAAGRCVVATARCELWIPARHERQRTSRDAKRWPSRTTTQYHWFTDAMSPRSAAGPESWFHLQR